MFNKKGYNRCDCGRDFMGQNPIVEPVITTCVEKEFYHEVPHE